MTRRGWTAAELERLRREYPDTPTGDLARELGRGVVDVFEKAQELGIEKSAEYRAGPLAGLLHRPKRRVWTDSELELLRREYADTPTAELAKQLDRSETQVYSKAQALGLKKSPEYLASPAACRLRRGDKVGASYRFPEGHVPWNKGKSYSAGGRSAETRFKPGHRPQTWVPVGTEALDKDGYRKRKVRDDAPPGWSRRNWKYVHVLLWEEHHGPVPPGHAVIFINGDKTDIRIDNLALASRADLMRKNTVHNLPRPLAEVIQLRGALQRQINKRLRSQR